MSTVLPHEPYLSDPIQLMALTIYREGRGEPFAAKVAIKWTVHNRCMMAPREGFLGSIKGNILKPFAFSSFNANDPNSDKYPDIESEVWKSCLEAAQSDEADPTGGAAFYFSRPLTEPPKAWGKVKHTATIGGLQFYTI